ncbi:MAG: hypothetical protein ABI589_11955, partial [Burkholderiales bacterium]
APLTENCRFYNCTHMHEPGCGLIAAVEAHDPSTEVKKREFSAVTARPVLIVRYKIYRELFAELSHPKAY